MRLAIAAALVLPLCSGTAPGQMPRQQVSPHARVAPVGLTDCRWTTGFWADRFAACRDVTVPSMGRLMWGTQPSQFLHNFRIAAGLERGTHVGPPWNDGDFYKWLEAAAAVYAFTREESLDRQLDEAIAILAKAQRSDGYLHTPVLIEAVHGGPGKPFCDRFQFEMYNLGHLFTAACVHAQATGKKTLLAIAIKAADFLVEQFRNPTPELARNSICPAHYMGILDLYRTTGNNAYLQLAEQWFALRDLVAAGTDDNQDRIPFRQQTEAVGHAVRANYLYAGAADLFLENGDQALAQPLACVWHNVVSRKMYVTGACGALFDGASPDGSRDQKQIARTHQAYGRDHQLPSALAHNETCASIGNVLWNWRMLAMTGDPKHADVMELALINAVLAGISLDGTRYFYTNTLRQLDAMPADLRWSRKREEWMRCYCCPPNVARTLAQVQRYAYGRSNSAIWVHLYGSGTLATTLPDGGRVQWTQQTDYPWAGCVKFTLDAMPERAIGIKLRIPAWARGAKVAVNGEPWPGQLVPGQYAELRRAWTAGDSLELALPMSVRKLEAHPLVEETRNQIAIQRGPIVYCLESVDLPKDVKVSTIRIPRDSTWQPRSDPRLLGGIVVLEGDAAASADSDWKTELYRELGPNRCRILPVRLIPYYAWGNRGASEMSVWLPLGP